MNFAHDFALDVAATAQHFALSHATVRAYFRSGRLPGVRLCGAWRTSWSQVWAVEQGPIPRGEHRQAYQLPLLSKVALASALSTSERTVERWIEYGMPTRKVFSNVRMAPRDAEIWLGHRFGHSAQSVALLKSLLRQVAPAKSP
ncbi:helix-turn-helix domain-containing protein [Pseudooceanicola sp. 200-1SW]